jgi:hypothetical protein
MKLIISYSTGSYDDYYEHHYAIEAESKEAFIVDFQAAFEAWTARKELEATMRSMLDTVRSLGKDMTKTTEWGMWCEYIRSDNYKHVDSLIIDSQEFAMIEDYKELDGGYAIKTMPDIYTLDEWFEANRPRKVE